MGYREPTDVLVVPPLSAPPLHPVVDVSALRRGDRVNVAGDIRTVHQVIVRGAGHRLMVSWQGRDWTEAPGPYNSAFFLEAVGAYLEEAA